MKVLDEEGQRALAAAGVADAVEHFAVGLFNAFLASSSRVMPSASLMIFWVSVRFSSSTGAAASVSAGASVAVFSVAGVSSVFAGSVVVWAGAAAQAAIARIMDTASRNARIFFTICFLLSNFTGNSAALFGCFHFTGHLHKKQGTNLRFFVFD